MRTFFKNRPRWYHGESNSPWYQRGQFLKKVLIFEKKGGADAFENDPSFISKGTVKLVACTGTWWFRPIMRLLWVRLVRFLHEVTRDGKIRNV